MFYGNSSNLIILGGDNSGKKSFLFGQWNKNNNSSGIFNYIFDYLFLK